MFINNFFKYKLPYLSNKLPNTLILVDDWKLITIYGKDSIKFLQNQLTSNIKSLKKNKYNISYCCDNKGKIISSMYVFYYLNKISILLRKNIYKNQILEFKKYSIFYRINFILNEKIVLLGISGFNSKKYLEKFFPKIFLNKKEVYSHKKTTILKLYSPIERFLIICSSYIKYSILNKLKKYFIKRNNNQWKSLEMESYFPIIEKNFIKKIIPNSINSNKINAIDFNKGCYIGQEIISKIKYKNSNKKSLFCLIGEHNFYPSNKYYLEYNINKKWKNAGKIISFCILRNKKILIQSILDKNLSNKYIIRLNKYPNTIFYIYKSI